MIKCLECDTENIDGTLYCENCGSDLNDTVPSDSPSEQDIPILLGGSTVKLIVTNSGEEILLPEKDEIIIGREDPVGAIFPDIDTSAYGGEDDGVSRKHAKIFRQGDEYFVEDLNSVNSTFLNKTQLDPEKPLLLSDGDELMLGRLKFDIAME